MTTEPAHLVFVDNSSPGMEIGIAIGRFEEAFEVAHDEKIHRVLLIMVVESQFVFVRVMGIGVHDLLRCMLHTVGYVLVENSLLCKNIQTTVAHVV